LPHLGEWQALGRARRRRLPRIASARSAALAIGTLDPALARSQVLAAIISGGMVVGMVIVWLLAA